MGDQPRGRAIGRSRGRAQKPPGTYQQPRQPGPAPGPSSGPAPGPLPGPSGPPQPPPVSAWGKPPQVQMKAPQQVSQQYGQQMPPSSSAGRASQRGAASTRGDTGVQEAASQMQSMSIGGEGDVPQGGGRGAMRGGRMLPQNVLRTRPLDKASKKGSSGRAFQITANYFKILSRTDWCLYQYRVDFSPEEDRNFIRKSLLRDHKNMLGGYIFDGTMLFTSHKLGQDVMEVYSVRKSDSAKMQITIKLVGDLAVGDYHYIQFFNILVRKCFGHLQLQLVGRNFFDAAARVTIPDFNLELWPGYVTSIRQHETELLMCAEISHKVMRQDNVLALMRECSRDRSYMEAFKKKVLGCIVMTDYNNKTYRVDDVDFNTNPRSTFTRGGQEVSYLQYYKEKYDIKIRDDRQPMLVSRAKARDRRAGGPELLYLVPELCRLTGLTDEMRNNNQLMRGLATHTRVDPSGRIRKLLAFKDRLLNNPNIVQDFNEWNLKLSDRLVTFPARVLDPEKIYDCEMVTCGNMEYWVVICPSKLERETEAWVDSVRKAANGMRFRIAAPKILKMQDDHVGSYVACLDQLLSQSNPSLVMAVVPNNRADRYNAIKKKCCVDRAVPTQVVTQRSITNPKGLMSIATKVAIQINCKTGGAPWCVEIPIAGLMVVGFDVCHDTANRSKSYGALVASLDNGLTSYFSAVSEHTTGEELSNDISANLVKALRKYKEVNQRLPARIMIYRDGVGEGQVNYVVEHEVELIKGTLRQVYGGDNFKLGFIIVTKRINTRFFDGDRNPPPGTVVDDVVTLPERYDFFLVSQSVRQGTVSPTSYNVVSDTIDLPPDRVQRLTYKLTHLYYNWSGTVRVPAPCQYAHKLAFLVGQSIHRAPRPELADRLYFL
ncbi:hypothetical protein J437_LFUL001768 [Ladona fulva]|uniref:Piwi n=1 Tax=Ladona fulva TaxID=123851 RepID=A0A8K0JWJ3_LADFU|nr:hypothetical protein J437_LFUL001768 [Ladona fulva]